MNVDVGKDDTIFATIEGVVVYDVIKGRKRSTLCRLRNNRRKDYDK